LYLPINGALDVIFLKLRKFESGFATRWGGEYQEYRPLIYKSKYSDLFLVGKGREKASTWFAGVACHRELGIHR
jgi:hypothetical protein